MEKQKKENRVNWEDYFERDPELNDPKVVSPHCKTPEDEGYFKALERDHESL